MSGDGDPWRVDLDDELIVAVALRRHSGEGVSDTTAPEAVARLISVVQEKLGALLACVKLGRDSQTINKNVLRCAREAVVEALVPLRYRPKPPGEGQVARSETGPYELVDAPEDYAALEAGLLASFELIYNLEHRMLPPDAPKRLANALEELASWVAENDPTPSGKPDAPEQTGRRKGGQGKLSPSRVRARAVYEWAIERIEGADRTPLRELFQQILEKLDAEIASAPPGAGEVEKLQELRKSLPSNGETFGKYLRDAGIKQYNARGERIRRISNFTRGGQL